MAQIFKRELEGEKAIWVAIGFFFEMEKIIQRGHFGSRVHQHMAVLNALGEVTEKMVNVFAHDGIALKSTD